MRIILILSLLVLASCGRANSGGADLNKCAVVNGVQFCSLIASPK